MDASYLKNEARRLRSEERLLSDEIVARLGGARTLRQVCRDISGVSPSCREIIYERHHRQRASAPLLPSDRHRVMRVPMPGSDHKTISLPYVSFQANPQ